MTTITHFSHPEHPLIQKEEGFVPENKALVCYGCNFQVENDEVVYSCTVCENWFLHKLCAQIPTQITHLKHPHHPLILVPRMPSLKACRICDSKPNVFAYRCNSCDFDVCGNCVYGRYPEHLLRLLEEDVSIETDVVCNVCDKPLTGSTIYTSTSYSGKKYYLHTTCVELPPKINHSSHTSCDLFLQLHLPPTRICDLCRRKSNTYRCDLCKYDVCVNCAFKDRVICHEGHKQHLLTLRYRKVLLQCDACGEIAKDSSYTCNTCDFWIHESCTSALTTISATTYHHHPLHLVYSIPGIHLSFERYCGLCKKFVAPRHWVYYCHRCTYFVHMRCATTWDGETMIKEIEGDCANDDPNLVQFPLATEESVFDLLIHQFRKSQIDIKEVGSTSSVVPEDPPNYVNGQHWSHTDHPLQEFHLSTFKDEEYDKDDEERLMVCDGCIQPISDAYPSFYGCIQCGFFLHKFCASALPPELPAGASPFHPEHSLFLRKMDKFYELIICGSCNFMTNGFYYHCETCHINIDIHCTFFPSRIKYEAHKSHSLVQCAASGSKCSISKMHNTAGFEYGCGTCSNFHIRKLCIFYPSRMRHRWDSHTVTLRYPPFFYEGVFYCQICEEQVDNNKWLYHCDDCDQSFHSYCLRPLHNVKLGQTIVHGIDNQKHTLTFVLKALKRDNSAPCICKICGNAFRNYFMLECAGCGYLVCISCLEDRILMEGAI